MRCNLALAALLAVAAFISVQSADAQTCFPVDSDVVSLGEANAQAYADKSLDRAIAARKTAIESSGSSVEKVMRTDLDCAPYPNLIGADEWRCKGRARVCATK